ASIGNYPPAIRELSAAITLRYQIPSCLFIRGCVYSALRQHTNAINDYSGVISIYNSYSDMFAYRGLALSRLGAGQAALSDCAHAISRNGSAENYAIRSVVNASLGDHASAASDYEMSLRIDPQQRFLRKLSWFVIPSDLGLCTTARS